MAASQYGVSDSEESGGGVNVPSTHCGLSYGNSSGLSEGLARRLLLKLTNLGQQPV